MYSWSNVPAGCIALGLMGACADPRTDVWDHGESPADSIDSGSSSAAAATTDGDQSSEPGPEPEGGSSTTEGFKFDVGGGSEGADSDTPPEAGRGCEFIDILFVVDISLSMEEERAQLVANFPGFVQVLDDYVTDPSTPANGYRIGITNSSIVDNGVGGIPTAGLDGSLVNTGTFGADCGNDGARWLDGPAPGLAEIFGCLADRPYGDCTADDCSDRGKERPFDATDLFMGKHAPGADNEGFYRGDTSLFVVVNLTDEDDDPEFSTTTPAMAVDSITDFTGGAERFVLVTIAGPEVGNCPPFGDGGNAFPAPRLHEFTALATYGLMGDVCQADLAPPLADALELIQGSCDVLPPPAG